MKIISRDRGAEYKNISGKYIHIADRFHLIMNLSKNISDHIKKKLNSNISLKINEDQILIDKEIKNDEQEISDATISKIELVKEIKREYRKGKNKATLRREYRLDHRTITKYIIMENIVDGCINQSGLNRSSKLNKNYEKVKEYYFKIRNVKILQKKLEEDKIYASYKTLLNFVNKYFNPKKNKRPEQDIIKVKRKDIINYVFDWKTRKEDHFYLEKIVEMFPFIRRMKSFYFSFKQLLVNNNRKEIKKIMERKYEDENINNFIKSLKKDQKAILNAAKYKINNGVTEGNVNKLKLIKRSMYGRASTELLRIKTIFQSFQSKKVI